MSEKKLEATCGSHSVLHQGKFCLLPAKHSGPCCYELSLCPGEDARDCGPPAMTTPPPSLAARVREREAKYRADVAECLADSAEADASNAKAGKVTNFAGEECADCEKAKVDAELLRECAEALEAKDTEIEGLKAVVELWTPMVPAPAPEE